jgi:hypothetical protein
VGDPVAYSVGLADFVEEHWCSDSPLQIALLLSGGASESASFVAEQLALQKAFAERSTIDRDESLARQSQVPYESGADGMVLRVQRLLPTPTRRQ